MAFENYLSTVHLRGNVNLKKSAKFSGWSHQSVNGDIYVISEPKNNYTYNDWNCAFELIWLNNTCTYIVMYWTIIRILISAKRLDSPCTVCFLLPSCSTFNGMYCSCYIVVLLLLLLSFLLCVVVCFAPWFPLELFLVYLFRIVSSHVCLYVHAFFFHSVPYALVSQSLFTLLSLLGTEIIRTLSSSGDSRVSWESFEVDYRSITLAVIINPFQSVNHQRPLKSQYKFDRLTSQI